MTALDVSQARQVVGVMRDHAVAMAEAFGRIGTEGIHETGTIAKRIHLNVSKFEIAVTDARAHLDAVRGALEVLKSHKAEMRLSSPAQIAFDAAMANVERDLGWFGRSGRTQGPLAEAEAARDKLVAVFHDRRGMALTFKSSEFEDLIPLHRERQQMMYHATGVYADVAKSVLTSIEALDGTIATLPRQESTATNVADQLTEALRSINPDLAVPITR